MMSPPNCFLPDCGAITKDCHIYHFGPVFLFVHHYLFGRFFDHSSCRSLALPFSTSFEGVLHLDPEPSISNWVQMFLYTMSSPGSGVPCIPASMLQPPEPQGGLKKNKQDTFPFTRIAAFAELTAAGCSLYIDSEPPRRLS